MTPAKWTARTIKDLAARKKRKRQLVQQYIWERCKRGQI